MLHKNVINNTKCISERKLSLKSSKCEKCVLGKIVKFISEPSVRVNFVKKIVKKKKKLR